MSYQSFIAHCSVSPIVPQALDALIAHARAQHESGFAMFRDHSYQTAFKRFKEAAALLMKVAPEDVAYVSNTAEGLNMLATAYPFQPGDEIIVYEHEYPSNYFPWFIQARRQGAELKILRDSGDPFHPDNKRPYGWSHAELVKLISTRTKIIALSHVQFTSGFTADLETLGRICKERNIDLVVDAAQSLGALPVEPLKQNLAAVVSSGWKWLMGPLGSGVLYTSKSFRNKLNPSFGGAHFGENKTYLDLSWCPHQDARVFEYSTVAISQLAALGAALETLLEGQKGLKLPDILLPLQEVFRQGLDRRHFDCVQLPEGQTSSILSVICKTKTMTDISAAAREKGLLLLGQGDYLRIAPHYHQKLPEMQAACELLNSIAAS